MKRLFGIKKAERATAESSPPNLDEQVAKVEERVAVYDQQLTKTEDEIRILFTKLKATSVQSEKEYIKSRLAQKLTRRAQITQQLNTASNRMAFISRMQTGMEAAKEAADMAILIKGTHRTLHDQLKYVDYDVMQDQIEEINELTAENEMMMQQANAEFEVQANEDIDAQLASIENELAMEELMQQNIQQKQTEYNPLKS